jgi:hypothetical protein
MKKSSEREFILCSTFEKSNFSFRNSLMNETKCRGFTATHRGNFNQAQNYQLQCHTEHNQNKNTLTIDLHIGKFSFYCTAIVGMEVTNSWPNKPTRFL